MGKLKSTNKQMHVTLTVSTIQNDQILKRLSKGGMSFSDYIYGLIQEDVSTHSDDSTFSIMERADIIKHYAKTFKRNRSYYY